MASLQALLNVENSSEYSNLRGVEYLFHEALDNGVLEQVLRKFPREQAVTALIRKQVLNFEVLQEDWMSDVLHEMNGLIELIPEGSLLAISKTEYGSVGTDSEEVFKLNGELNRLFRRIADQSLDAHERAFLRDFFYGVDFTHWVKWAILLHYTDIEARIPTILRARRNGVGISIRNDALIFSIPEGLG